LSLLLSLPLLQFPLCSDGGQNAEREDSSPAAAAAEETAKEQFNLQKERLDVVVAPIVRDSFYLLVKFIKDLHHI
jgi:hypothetical protein